MLTRRDIVAFERDGYVPVRGAFSRSTAAHCRRTIANRLRATGIDVDDPTTWRRPVALVPWPATASFTAAGTAPSLTEVYDQLLGPGAWESFPTWGGVVFARFPNRRRARDAVWHVDGTFPRDGVPVTTLGSDNRGVLCLVLLSDVGEDDGPTELLVGSHLDVPPILEPAGDEGRPFSSIIEALPATTFERPVVQVTGRAGDVYVCHPFLVHRGPERNRGSAPRLVAQPGIVRHRPFRLEGGRPRPVERAIRTALATSGTPTSATRRAPARAAATTGQPRAAEKKTATRKTATRKTAATKKTATTEKTTATKKTATTKATATKKSATEQPRSTKKTAATTTRAGAPSRRAGKAGAAPRATRSPK